MLLSMNGDKEKQAGSFMACSFHLFTSVKEVMLNGQLES